MSSFALLRSARLNCYQRTTSSWAARSGQSYLGCVFPADPGYAPLITREAAKVGNVSPKKVSSGASLWILWSCARRMENGSRTRSRLT